jgi:pimeloyl-ACP methyl ester carboxylesterase
LVAQEATRGGWPIDAVVLYDPILVGLLDQHKPDQSQARIWDQGVIEQLSNHVAAGNAEAGVRHFVEAWNETSWTALPAPARSQLIANAANLVTETTAVSTYSISRPDLAAFKTPVLLLQGERSPPIVGCMIDEALLVLPNAVRTKLPACGHMGPLLRPDIIAEAANAFLQGILN